MTVLKDLYGGAIQSQLPDGLIDISDLRQVPDTQEAFVSDEDASFIFDVNQAVPQPNPLEAIKHVFDYSTPQLTHARFHFEALADDNTASSCDILSVSPPASPDAPCLLYGRQSVAKYRQGPEDADLVHIYLALWRIPAKNTDLVNVPRGKAANATSDALNEPTEYRQQFELAASSLRILDYGLFP